MYIFQKFKDVKENMISQCNFQSGLHPSVKASKSKMHKEKETSPMANIMTPVHIVSQNIAIAMYMYIWL